MDSFPLLHTVGVRPTLFACKLIADRNYFLTLRQSTTSDQNVASLL